MKCVINGHEYDIPEKIILGFCKVCSLPLVTYEIYDVLGNRLDERILFKLVNVCDDIHESCLEEITNS